MKEKDLIKKLIETLEASKEHHEYCGWGDNWEREGAMAQKLPEQIDEAISEATQYLSKA